MNNISGKWIFGSDSTFFILYINDDLTFNIVDSNIINPFNWNYNGYLYFENNNIFFTSDDSEIYFKGFIKSAIDITFETNKFAESPYLFRLNNKNDKSPKIAFITAIYGLYESECQKFAIQTLPTDFICFTNMKDTDNFKSNGWIIDNNEYHYRFKSRIDNDLFTNSLANNKHTFNIAKYYKQNFYSIPVLLKYDYIVWIDGSIEITNPDTSKYVIDKLSTNTIITGEHNRIGKNKMYQEMIDSNYFRYTSTYWFNQHQPYQDIFKQYLEYLNTGYDDIDYWENKKDSLTYGLWITCFIGFDINNKDTIRFLDEWYLQTLKYTTQDQLGFPYACFQLGINPYSFPDNHVNGDNNEQNTLYIKHNHYRKSFEK